MKKKRVDTAKFEKMAAGLPAVLLFAVMVCTVVLSLVPPVSRDALVHHLAVPKLYLAHKAMVPLPCMPYSYFPMNLGLLYTAALFLGSDIAPKLIHGIFGLMTAWLIHRYIREKIGRVYGLWGALLFLSVPVVIKLSITAYVDLGLVFFSTASMLLLLKWVDTGFPLRHLVRAGVFCGLALGTKYNGLVVFILLALFVPWARERYSGKKGVIRSVQYFFVFTFIALAVYSPWMIRNWAWTRNPFHPLYGRYFPATAADTCLPASLEQYREKPPSIDVLTYRKVMYGEKWWEMALLPIRIFFQGKDNDLKRFDGQLSLALLFLPMLAFARPGKNRTVSRNRNGPDAGNRHEKSLLAFLVLFGVVSFFSAVLRIRYLTPIIPPLVILSIFGLKNGVDHILNFRSKLKRTLLFVFIAVVAGYHLLLSGTYLAAQFRYVKPFAFISGQVSRDRYIAMFRGEYPVFRYINHKLPVTAKVLFFYVGRRGYYCDRAYIPDHAGNLSILFGMIKAGMAPDRMADELKKGGVTHLLMHHALVETRIADELAKHEMETFAAFLTGYTTPLYSQNGFGLHALL